MDEFRVVIYVVLGIIFVVSRIIKANKSSGSAPKRRPRPTNPQDPNKPAPTSYEDILKEFGEKVEEKTVTRERPVGQQSAPKPNPIKKNFDEGRDRRFSDDESRRIYEESVKRAEGFDLKFGENANYDSKRTKFGEGAIKKDVHEKNPLIKSIRNDLKSKDGIKKAFILNEILTRKY